MSSIKVTMVVVMVKDLQREDLLVDFQTFHFGHGPESEDEGGRKGWQIVPLAPSISAPVPPCLSTSFSFQCPDSDFAAALMPLAVAQVYLWGSAKFQRSDKFSGRLGAGGRLPEVGIALQAWGQSGYFDASAWGEGPREECIVWREETL